MLKINETQAVDFTGTSEVSPGEALGAAMDNYDTWAAANPSKNFEGVSHAFTSYPNGTGGTVYMCHVLVVYSETLTTTP